jgi:hypothetical protein
MNVRRASLSRERPRADGVAMGAARSILWLISALVVVMILYLTVLSGGSGTSGLAPRTGAPATSASPYGVYGGAVGAAQNAVQQANQDAQRASGTTASP